MVLVAIGWLEFLLGVADGLWLAVIGRFVAVTAAAERRAAGVAARTGRGDPLGAVHARRTEGRQTTVTPGDHSGQLPAQDRPQDTVLGLDLDTSVLKIRPIQRNLRPGLDVELDLLRQVLGLPPRNDQP